MADYYKDFVFTRNTTTVAAVDTAITVEDVSLFPSNALLAKSQYYIAFESTLSYPHTFEIMQLSSVTVATKTLNVIRGQAGTTAQTHAIVTYIKGTLTSDMVRRARYGFSGTVAPAPDYDLFGLGDRLYHPTEGRFYAFTAQAGYLKDTFTRAASALTMGNTETQTVTAASAGLSTIPGQAANVTVPYTAPWIPYTGVFGINGSNQAYLVSGASGSSQAVNVGGLNFDISFDVFATTNAVSDYGIHFRTDINNAYGYYLQFLGTTATLYRYSTTYTSLALTATYTTGVAHTWRITTNGNVLAVYRDGTNVMNFTETVAGFLTTGALPGANVGFRYGSTTATTDTAIYWDNFTCTTFGNTGLNLPTPQGWAPTADVPGSGGAAGQTTFLSNQLAAVETNLIQTVNQLDDVIQVDANLDSSLVKHGNDLTTIFSTFDDLLPVIQQHDGHLTDLALTDVIIATQLDELVDTLKASVSLSGQGPPGGLQAVAGTIYSDTIGKILYYYTGSAWVAITYSGPGAVIPPITYVGSTVYTSTSYPNVVSFPAGTLVGDTAIVFFATGQSAASYSAVAGWTLMFNVSGNYNYSYNACAAYYKVLTAADITAGNATFTQPNFGGVNMNGLMRVYRNGIIDAFANTGGTSTINTVQTESLVTTTQPSDFIVHFFNDSTTSSSIGGIGAWATNPASSFNFYYTSIYGADEIQTPIGASTQRTYTLGGTSNNVGWNALTVALKPSGTIVPPAIYAGAGYPTTLTGVQGSLYYDTTSQAVYVYDTAWLGVNCHAVLANGDYTAKGNDHVLATTTASGRSSYVAAVDAFVQDINAANPATQSLTTTTSDLFVGIRASWLAGPFTATIDGATFPVGRTQATYSAGQAIGTMFATSTNIAAGTHSIVYTGPTSYSIAWAETIAVKNATSAGAVYTSTPGNNLTINTPAGPGVIVLYAQVNGGTPPTMTSAGGLTWTARGSQAHGSQNASTCWTATYPTGTSTVAVTFSPNDTSYGFTIAGAFPAVGNLAAYDAANYTLITLPANAQSAKITVQSNDLAGNEIRVVPASGTINGNASDSLYSRYLYGKYVSDGTNWYRDGGGSYTPTVVTKTAAYTAVPGDIVLANATTAAFTVTLPPPLLNFRITVKKTDSSANPVTVAGPGATPTTQIDGVTTYVLAAQYSVVRLVGNGTSWAIV